MFSTNTLQELTPEQIDFQLNFIDMLFFGREEITAKKQIVS